MTGSVTPMRIAGIALLVLLAVHPFLRPEGGWALLSTCDLAAFATAIGLVTGAHRWVTTALVFQVAVGMPAFIMGLFTTYEANLSGIAIHVVPIVLGMIVAARHGIAPRAALHAWLAYAVSIVIAAAVAPAELNINFAAKVWPPLAGTMRLWMFQASLVAVVGVLLALGELGLRLVWSSSRRDRGPMRPRDTA